MAQTTREGHLITQELRALSVGPAEVTVHLLGGQVIEGHSTVVAISRRGFPIQTGGPGTPGPRAAPARRGDARR